VENESLTLLSLLEVYGDGEEEGAQGTVLLLYYTQNILRRGLRRSHREPASYVLNEFRRLKIFRGRATKASALLNSLKRLFFSGVWKKHPSFSLGKKAPFIHELKFRFAPISEL